MLRWLVWLTSSWVGLSSLHVAEDESCDYRDREKGLRGKKNVERFQPNLLDVQDSLSRLFQILFVMVFGYLLTEEESQRNSMDGIFRSPVAGTLVVSEAAVVPECGPRTRIGSCPAKYLASEKSGLLLSVSDCRCLL